MSEEVFEEPDTIDEGKAMRETCEHLGQVRRVKPSSQGCEDCLKIGDDWVHLRLCRICGHVGCCDSSKNRHATKHFQGTGHPIIQSSEPGETWGYCYVDKLTFESLEGVLARRGEPA